MSPVKGIVKAATNMFVITNNMEKKLTDPMAKITSGVVCTALACPAAAPAMEQALKSSFGLHTKVKTAALNKANKLTNTGYSVEQAQQSKFGQASEHVGDELHGIAEAGGADLAQQAFQNTLGNKQSQQNNFGKIGEKLDSATQAGSTQNDSDAKPSKDPESTKKPSSH